ncbi:uroporphyrinogen decarboxylase [Aureispira anguillae]|uniref:Uroporphyrinogen decarboxylase n=1 Tax=Aureispira anguillae TaxID=2864201 RepID=A0A916DTW7_9BACT|nr:uroporphyrinogen decarboxylase [Aureispira anguillae]BDS13629.1 uroporphyrinogen decarboxylase [Aureispira anguillae]
MLKNDLFLRAARGEKTERPPVWLMRQAGRILPQYRALRASLSGFKELVETPELACEVTIQPIDELGVDAAIIFSDILVIPEAMGLPYEMIPGKGPLFPKTITSEADIDGLLEGEAAAEDLGYVYEALKITKRELNGRVPLIGFAGAPFTIFCYMLEGQGSKTFSKAKKVMYQNPVLAHKLLDKITTSTIAYLKRQVESGADLIQVFDSWAGVLTPNSFKTFSLPYMKRIAEALNPMVPVTLFAKGAWHSLTDISNAGCNVVGLGWTQTPADVRALLGANQVVQGNLDPCALYADKNTVQTMTKTMLQAYGQHHIANLGHGVYPDTPLDSVKVFVDTVKQFEYAASLEF